MYYKLKSDSSIFPAITIIQNIKEEKIPQTIKLTYEGSNEYKVNPVKGLNTDDLLILLSKKYACFKNIGTKVTNLLSTMYLQGAITYPRTENKSYNNYRSLLEETSMLYKQQTGLEPIIPTSETQNTTTDHSPISPLKKVSEVSDVFQKKVLKAMYEHLKKVYSGHNIYSKIEYSFHHNNKKHKISLLKKVHKAFEDSLLSYDNLITQDLVIDVKKQEARTKCPPYYSFSTLLKQASKHNIGTKSTRTVIIQNLLKNKYLVNDKGFKLTTKANFICKYWSRYFPQILCSKFTSDLQMLFQKLRSREQLLQILESYKQPCINTHNGVFKQKLL